MSDRYNSFNVPAVQFLRAVDLWSVIRECRLIVCEVAVQADEVAADEQYNAHIKSFECLDLSTQKVFWGHI